jgi:drug/metabolite transporter (DMT)-like permease
MADRRGGGAVGDNRAVRQGPGRLGLSPLQVVAVRVASIFGKLALRRYEPLTVTTHTFIFAAAAVLPFSGLWEQRALLAAWQVWGYAAGLGLVSTVLGLSVVYRGLEVCRAWSGGR